MCTSPLDGAPCVLVHNIVLLGGRRPQDHLIFLGGFQHLGKRGSTSRTLFWGTEHPGTRILALSPWCIDRGTEILVPRSLYTDLGTGIRVPRSWCKNLMFGGGRPNNFFSHLSWNHWLKSHDAHLTCCSFREFVACA